VYFLAYYLTFRWCIFPVGELQDQLQMAQGDKRDLQEALDQVRAQIIANQTGIVTAATEVSFTHTLSCFFSAFAVQEGNLPVWVSAITSWQDLYVLC
jgi:hypothetical protein